MLFLNYSFTLLKQLIPKDMKFDTQSNPPAFVSEDETVRISKDDEVRLKIVGTRVDATEIVCFLLYFIYYIIFILLLFIYVLYFNFKRSFQLAQLKRISLDLFKGFRKSIICISIK